GAPPARGAAPCPRPGGLLRQDRQGDRLAGGHSARHGEDAHPGGHAEAPGHAGGRRGGHVIPVTCAEVAELAPELALGTLPGDQRASVLAHLDGCGRCRRLVKELADTADALLLLAPEVEPPAGFARRVARGLRPARSSRWRPAVAAAVVALVVGL